MKFFNDLKNSFYNFPEYRKMIKRSYGAAILYAVFFSLILSFIVTIKVGFVLNDGVKEMTNFYNSEVPYFEFHDGELDVDTELPYSTGDDSGMLYIDTRKEADQTIVDNYEEGFFLFRDKAIQKTAIKTETYEFSQFGAGDFTKDDVDKIYPKIKGYKVIAYIAIYIGYFIFSLVSFLALSLIYGLIGLIVNAIFKSKLSFTQLASASIYALTVPKVIKLLVSFTKVEIPYFWLISAIIMIFYLVMIVKQKDEEMLLIEE